MLDMGFIHDVRRIIADAAARSARRCCSRPPCRREIARAGRQHAASTRRRVAVTPGRVDGRDGSSRRCYFVEQGRQARAARAPARGPGDRRACWSSRAPSTAPTASPSSSQRAGIAADAIHGNKSQNARERALDELQGRRTSRVLVATDIAARGIDVDGITHVINFDLPERARDLRAPHRPHRRGPGRSGVALSFCDAPRSAAFLRDIERIVKRPIEVLRDQPFHTNAAPVQAEPARPAARPAMPRRHRPHAGAGGGRGGARADGSRRRW